MGELRSKPFSSICIFIMITALKNFAVSQSYCSLDFNISSPLNTSSCEAGDWGGFLRTSCCGSTFNRYLYALGHHAKQTGNIYLNSSEQSGCLGSLRGLEENAYSCGIEKLTSGAGGCSDYSVEEVRDKLTNELRDFDENCKSVSSDVEQDQTCGSCVRSWESIKGPRPLISSELEDEICRFAVMVSSTSTRIDDETYVFNVYKCLAEKITHTAPDTKKKKKLSAGISILIAGSCAVALIIIFASIMSLERYYKSNPPSKRTSFKDVQLKDPGCPKFPIKEVNFATNNLSEINIIGEGTAGKVYKGILSNNQHVAIKHIISDGNVETFVREVASLSHVKHPNLVALLGYCLRADEGFLIYELCPNGNLSKWLFGKDKVLSWIQRLEIAIDCARGLHFLHTYSEGCIVHRDIKPTNILLGRNFEAKLSDFGLSKVIDVGETYVSSEVRGTFGYVDPEYQNNRQVNSSGDVYSYGIVLLQILSGKRVINMNLRKPMPIDKMAKVLTRGGSIIEFADPKLGKEYSVEAFELILQLALSCTSLKQQRPHMAQVVVALESALDISTTAKSSTTETSPDEPLTP